MHLWFSVIPSPDGKRSMMKLAQRMVNNFCASINPSNGHQWTTHFGINEVEVRSSLHKSTDPGQPSGVVLSAAATIWLPVSPQNVFNFFRDERTRPQVCRHTDICLPYQTLHCMVLFVSEELLVYVDDYPKYSIHLKNMVLVQF